MKLHHLALRCSDVEATARFYQDVLALPVLRRQAGYSIWLSAEDVVLMFEARGQEEPQLAPGSNELLAFAVDEAGKQALLQILHAKHISVETQTEYTYYFRDPDGRRVGISSYHFEAGYPV